MKIKSLTVIADVYPEKTKHLVEGMYDFEILESFVKCASKQRPASNVFLVPFSNIARINIDMSVKEKTT